MIEELPMGDYREAERWSPPGFHWSFRVAAQPPANTTVVKQVQGIAVIDAAEALPSDEADGLYLRQAGKIAVKSADCLPILLAFPGGKPLAMALHAGWRSLAGGIVQAAGKLWRNFGVETKDARILLGPTLCLRHFEVGPEVVSAFAQRHLGLSIPELSVVVERGKGDRSYIDLSRAAFFMLVNLGIAPNSIAVLDSCTFCHPQLWPSSRRDRGYVQSIWSTMQMG